MLGQAIESCVYEPLTSVGRLASFLVTSLSGWLHIKLHIGCKKLLDRRWRKFNGLRGDFAFFRAIRTSDLRQPSDLMSLTVRDGGKQCHPKQVALLASRRLYFVRDLQDLVALNPLRLHPHLRGSASARRCAAPNRRRSVTRRAWRRCEDGRVSDAAA